MRFTSVSELFNQVRGQELQTGVPELRIFFELLGFLLNSQ
jgi:hypothetical protein